MATPPYASPLEEPTVLEGGFFQQDAAEMPGQAYADFRVAYPPSPAHMDDLVADPKLFAHKFTSTPGDASLPQRLLRLEEDVLALSLSTRSTAVPGSRRAIDGEAGSQMDRLLVDRVDRISERLDALMLQMTEERALRQQDLVDTNTRLLAVEARRDGESPPAQMCSMVRQEVDCAVAQLKRSLVQPQHRNDDLEQRIISLAVTEACKSLHGESDFWRREVMRLDAAVVQGRGRIDAVESAMEEIVKTFGSGKSLPDTSTTLSAGVLDTDRASFMLLDGAVSTLKASVEEIKAGNRRSADELGRRIDQVEAGLRNEFRSVVRNTEVSIDTNSEVLPLADKIRRCEVQHAEFRQHLDDIWARIASERMERHERHNALTCKMEHGLQRLIQKLDKGQGDTESLHDIVGSSPATSPVAGHRFISPPSTQVRPPSVKKSPVQTGRSPSRGSPHLPTRSTLPLTSGYPVASQLADSTSLRASVGTPLAITRSALVGVRSMSNIGFRPSAGAAEPPPSSASYGPAPVTIIQTPQQSHRPLGSPLRGGDRSSLRNSVSPPGGVAGHRLSAQGSFLPGSASPPPLATPAMQSRGSLAMAPSSIHGSPQPHVPSINASRAAALAAASAAACSAVAASAGGSRAASPVAMTRGACHRHATVGGPAPQVAVGPPPVACNAAGSAISAPGGACSPCVAARPFSQPAGPNEAPCRW